MSEMIPGGWDVVPVSNLFEVINGTTPSTIINKYWDGGVINWVTPADLNKCKNKLNIITSKRKITKIALENCNLKLMPKNSIIISCRAPVGYVAIVSIESTFNQGCKGLIRKNVEISYLFYAYLLLKSKNELNNISGGSTFKELSKTALLNLKLLYPPLPEQEKIASILSRVDHQIQLTEEIITKTEELKKGLMQRLLTKGIGHTEFKESELGMIPEDWDVIKLGEHSYITKLAGFEYTNYFNGYKDGGEIIVVRGTNITHNKLNLNNVKTIPREISKKLPRSQLKKGDLVLAYVGTIGPIYLIKQSDKFHLGPNTAKITLDKYILPEYGFQYFTSWLMKDEINRQISVSAQPSLSMTKIRTFRFIMPNSIEEQKIIISILSNTDTQIQDNKQELVNLNQLKKGLMQDLLTGKVRVKV